MKKYYWIISWLEKWPDGTVNGFRTAVHSESLTKAVEHVEVELRIRAKANATECIITNAGMADDDIADLVGKAETDSLAIDWPE